MSAKILLVDDHLLFCDGLRLILKRASEFEVVGESGSVRGALELALTLKPDIVVMDVNLPDGNGIDACRQLGDVLPQTKVLMLSGHTDMSAVKAAVKAGARGYLLKDQASDEFLRALRSVMEGQIYLCPEAATALVENCLEEPKAVRLSEREVQVLKSIADGLRNKEIAAQLNISTKSVETYRARLMAKLECQSTAQLVRYALREGLANP